MAQAVCRQSPTAEAQVRYRMVSVRFVVGKWHWGRFAPSTSVSPISAVPKMLHNNVSFMVHRRYKSLAIENCC
jgi:hypothetical protein